MTLRDRARRLSDRVVFALTLWAEARGESIEGRVAVGCVVRNRMARRRQTVSEVCLARAQFSCWDEAGGRTNYRALEQAVSLLEAGTAISDPVLAECLWIADGVHSGAARDITHGADHYLTTTLLSSAHKPEWVWAMTFCVAVGSHAFYRS